MVSFAYPLRFFRVVAPLPPLVGWTFLVLVLIGTLVIVHDPTRAASALIPVLLLQLFAEQKCCCRRASSASCATKSAAAAAVIR